MKGDRTLSEIAAHHEVHVKLVQAQAWKKQMQEQAAMVFASSIKPVSLKESESKQAELFEQIGRLKMELEWLKKKSCRLRVIGSDSRSSRTTRS